MVKTDVKRDYYADLELKSSADTEDIKKQFRKLALKYHPDRNPGREVEFNSKFQAIQAANEILTDPQQRAKYDADRLKSGYGSAFPNPLRPTGPSRPTPTKFPPPPRSGPPQPSKPAYPKTPATPKANATFGAHRYTKFAKSEAEAKQARASAEQWEKAKEDAETKAGAFRGWEQMKSSVNQQHFRAPPRPPAQDYSGSARGIPNSAPSRESPKPKQSWEQFPGGQPGFPNVSRVQSARRPKQGFAPNTPGGDEPQARNTSAYFNVSRGDRPQASMPQSYFDSPTPRVAPTAKKRDPLSPLRHSRSHGGADEPLSGLETERVDGRYAHSGAGEKTFFGNVGLGRSTSVRDPSGLRDPPVTNPSVPKPSYRTGRHRSASPNLTRANSSSSSSSDSSDEEGWAANPKQASHRMSAESSKSDSRPRFPVKDFGEAKTVFDQSGRYGPREPQMSPNTSKTAQDASHPSQGYANFSPTQTTFANGSNPQQARFGVQTSFPPPPPYPPPTLGKDQQRPLEKSKTWEDNKGQDKTNSHGVSAGPISAGPANPQNMYGFSFPHRSTPKTGDRSNRWPFTAVNVPGSCFFQVPYWAYPSSVLPQRSAPSKRYTSSHSSSENRSSSPRKTAKSNRTQKANVPVFPLPIPLASLPANPFSLNLADPKNSFSFSFPEDSSASHRNQPSDFKKYSSENLNTTFNSADWDGKFNSSNEYFAPAPPDGTRASRATSSPTRGRQPGRMPAQSPDKDSEYAKGGSATTETQIPIAGAHTPPAPFSPAKFSLEEWTEKLKYSSPAVSNQAAPNRSRNTRQPSKSSIKRPSTAKPATVSDDIEHEPAQETPPVIDVDASLDAGPMDIDLEEPAAPVQQPGDLPSGSEAPLVETKNVYIQPQRPEWRANATETGMSPNFRQSSRQAAQPVTTNHAFAPATQEKLLNLDNLSNVTPLAPSKDGLEGIADLSTNLPFESQASNNIPRPQPKPLIIPNPPKGPEPPSRLTQQSWERYIAEMSAYMFEWSRYNKLMLQHFNGRQADFEISMAPKWMSVIGDSSVGDGKKGYTDYMQALEDDVKVRTHWDVSWDKHRETLQALGNVRARLKKTAAAGGVMA